MGKRRMLVWAVIMRLCIVMTAGGVMFYLQRQDQQLMSEGTKLC